MSTDDVAQLLMSEPIAVEANTTAIQLGKLIKKTSDEVVDIGVRIVSLHPLEDRRERDELSDEVKKLQQCLHHLFLALEALR